MNDPSASSNQKSNTRPASPVELQADRAKKVQELAKNLGRPEPKDMFPLTQSTRIHQLIEDGEISRPQLLRYIMEVYYSPLSNYYRTWSKKFWLGEADDVISGFFEDRLKREDFLVEWQKSEKKLRYWLINALNFYLREQARKIRRDQRIGEIPEHADFASDEPSSHAELERDYKIQSVQRALQIAAKSCQEAGLETHWQVFIARYLHQESYSTIIGSHSGLDAARAAVMARSAKARFCKALRDQFLMEGVAPENIDLEINYLIESED